ncbi:MAG TPA: endonuclease domain-containing protein [Allosphingosinicella sp.]|nr:endonuclease domain-containing protein [Allosphingosinicella sp.]
MLKKRARDLRNNSTDAEQRLWGELRQFRPRFTRQFVIGNAIADFACRKAKLVIELDGGQHSDSDADARRTETLQKLGWQVMRFWNHDVLENTDGVMETVVAAVATRLPEGAHPRPLPEIREGRIRQERAVGQD